MAAEDQIVGGFGSRPRKLGNLPTTTGASAGIIIWQLSMWSLYPLDLRSIENIIPGQVSPRNGTVVPAREGGGAFG